MGTATFRPARLGASALALLLLAFALVGCGSSGGSAKSAAASTSLSAVSTVATSSGGTAFAWLRPQAAPPGWSRARIADGAVLHFPPGWAREHGDAGTATAVLTDAHGRLRGYLNVTPHQGDERPATWTSFRVHHNAGEGDRDVRTEAAATNLPFVSGHGSCVKDRYRTISNAQYIELACLVAGAKTSAVIVAAGLNPGRSSGRSSSRRSPLSAPDPGKSELHHPHSSAPSARPRRTSCTLQPTRGPALPPCRGCYDFCEESCPWRARRKRCSGG
jgi:hypothetical protein